MSIEEFIRGCRPIIAIDLSHMSRPHGGALFSATTSDANDNMFLVALGVMNSEHYEDWSWFLNNLKNVARDKEVVIIRIDIPVFCKVS